MPLDAAAALVSQDAKLYLVIAKRFQLVGGGDGGEHD